MNFKQRLIDNATAIFFLITIFITTTMIFSTQHKIVNRLTEEEAEALEINTNVVEEETVDYLFEADVIIFASTFKFVKSTSLSRRMVYEVLPTTMEFSSSLKELGDKITSVFVNNGDGRDVQIWVLSPKNKEVMTTIYRGGIVERVK